MAITPLPTPPSRTDPTNFSDRGDAFLGALPKFQVEANALAVAMNLNSTTDSSTSSITIGTGDKTFVVSSGKSFQPGMYLVLADVAAPSTNSMFGQITSYSGTSLVMSIISVRGSGTIASWIISQSSAGGAQAGPLASSGITGAAASGANTDITSITGNAATATTAGNGSNNQFWTAGTGELGEENAIGVKCNGYNSAYLFNSEHHWGLHSAGQGGIILEYVRATGKTYMYGTATTATTATTALNAIGVGQTWQDFSASRVIGGTYTNSTGRSILVNVSCIANGAGAWFDWQIGGASFGSSSASYANGARISAVFLVPHGATYRVYFPVFGDALSFQWSELR